MAGRSILQSGVFSHKPSWGSGLEFRIVNTPPTKAGGFPLRLKAGPIGQSADYHSLSHPRVPQMPALPLEGVVKGCDPFSPPEGVVKVPSPPRERVRVRGSEKLTL